MAIRPKAEVIPFRRGANIEDEAEIPLASASAVMAFVGKAELSQTDIDLTGKPEGLSAIMSLFGIVSGA